MTTFTIDAENKITAYRVAITEKGRASGSRETFGSERELARVSKEWPVSRLAAIWNGLPGVIGVRIATRPWLGFWKAIRTFQPIRKPHARGRGPQIRCRFRNGGT